MGTWWNPSPGLGHQCHDLPQADTQLPIVPIFNFIDLLFKDSAVDSNSSIADKEVSDAAAVKAERLFASRHGAAALPAVAFPHQGQLFKAPLTKLDPGSQHQLPPAHPAKGRWRKEHVQACLPYIV